MYSVLTTLTKILEVPKLRTSRRRKQRGGFAITAQYNPVNPANPVILSKKSVWTLLPVLLVLTNEAVAKPREFGTGWRSIADRGRRSCEGTMNARQGCT